MFGDVRLFRKPSPQTSYPGLIPNVFGDWRPVWIAALFPDLSAEKSCSRGQAREYGHYLAIAYGGGCGRRSLSPVKEYWDALPGIPELPFVIAGQEASHVAPVLHLPDPFDPCVRGKAYWLLPTFADTILSMVRLRSNFLGSRSSSGVPFLAGHRRCGRRI
jgi:hypothetical protein